MNLKPFITFIAIFALSSNAAALNAKFSDKTWDGKLIPKGQQCQKFGGDHPATPRLLITDIPAGSDSLILEYSDRDSQRMNNGGHGKMRFTLNSANDHAEVPSIAGHTFDLPPAFTMITAHQGPNWDKAGAYMPPCSGGKNHRYYLTIKSVKNNDITAETVIEMGNY